MKKLTKEEFVEKAILVHDNLYNYEESNYINYNTKINIICRQHGIFYQTPGKHIFGRGCPKCNGGVRLNTENFIQKAIKIHQDNYNYSFVNYVNNSTKIKIVCKLHGIFEQKPSAHLIGKGCDACGGTKNHTTESFILEANKIHNFKYNYELAFYTLNYNKIKIICNKHGIFEQKAASHLRGKGCSKCSKKYTLSFKEFVEKSIIVHNNKYHYTNDGKYKNHSVKIKITCPNHGEFLQIPQNHLNGQGCKKCADVERGKNKALTNEKF